jgi:predicted nucleotide-binding protein (sugar kinase/HSP70/actin superfamily)
MANKKPLQPVEFKGLLEDVAPAAQSLGTYPSLGVMNELVESVVEFTDDKILSPKPNSTHSLNLGMLHAPEGACLPLKLIMGNLMESMERGANMCAMITEHGPCRLGLYNLGIRLIFADMGLGSTWFEFNNTSIKQGYIARFKDLYRRKYGRRLSMFSLAKGFIVGLNRLAAVEVLEAERNRWLACEIEPGSIEQAFRLGRSRIRQAKTPPTVWYELFRARRMIRRVPIDKNRPTVRVVLTGEVYCVVDPFANSHIEAKLARLGAEPYRVLWQTDYLLDGMGLSRLRGNGRRAAIRAAKGYLPEDLGGDCTANVGHALLAQRRGDDGMIHIKPFACMLEIVAENLLRSVERSTGFPIISLTLDDLSGEERLSVRLEAFVENLFRRKRLAHLGQERRG